MCPVPAKPQEKILHLWPRKLNICGQLKIQHKTLICDGNYPETAWRSVLAAYAQRPPPLTPPGWKSRPCPFLHAA